MMALLQSDAEIGEILMRAFILRRVELVAAWCGRCCAHRVDTFGRNVQDQRVSNAQRTSLLLHRSRTRHPDVQNLLDSFHIAASDIPAVICQGKIVLRNPSNQQIADCLGFNDAIDQTQVRDIVIIGAGPSGLAGAAVWRLRRT